jgi:xylulokinase
MLLGIDIGTSGTKTVLFDLAGNPLAAHTAAYPMETPRAGWAEQNPEDWWRATVEGIRAVLAQSGASAADIRGIGLSGQMNGHVMLDADGEVLAPAILWCDLRATEEAAEMEAMVGAEKIVEITGNHAFAGLGAAKILWMKRHRPEIYERTRHILLPKDYVRFRLTGEYAAEVSDASGLQLLDINTRRWSRDLISKLGLDIDKLPPVYESPEVSGAVSRAAADITGLRAGTPVAGGAGDNPAAGVGMGAMTDGRAFTTIGTSGVPYMLTERVLMDMQGRVNCLCAAAPGKWMLMGCVQSAGYSLKWLRDTVCAAEIAQAEREGRDAFEIMDELAAAVPPGSRGLLFLPYLMGERSPHTDADCRGVFFGLSSVHGRAEMIRAVMEGVSFSLRECVEVYGELGCRLTDMRICGGGGKSRLWRQMLADIYGESVSTVQSSEGGAALGAAILAGVGTSEYASVEQACAAIIRTGETHTPDMAAHAKYEGYYELHKRLYGALYGAFRDLARLM